MYVIFLVVEDDPVSATVIREILRPFGESHVANDGATALRFFRESLDGGVSYDCVFLDIMMPDMDGHETLEALRGEEERRNLWGSDAVRVVMVTALGDFENVRMSFREQCDGYLVKPIRRERVFALLRELGLVKESAGETGGSIPSV
jgi:two-component system chemotaxis response regulator CheY